MKETIKLGLTLFLFTAIAAGVLALTNSFTSPIIAEIEKEASFKALSELFPEAEDFEELDSSEIESINEKYPQIVEVHKILQAGDISGYAFKTESSGYGDDPIVAITGIDSEGTLVGIDIVSHSETPGFGEAIVEDRFKDTFKGKPIESVLIPVETPEEEDEVMMISGSTISTDGVLAGVNEAREVYRESFSE